MNTKALLIPICTISLSLPFNSLSSQKIVKAGSSNHIEAIKQVGANGETAVYGLAQSTDAHKMTPTNFSTGVFGQSDAPNGNGVYGSANTGVFGGGGFVGVYATGNQTESRVIWGSNGGVATRFAGYFDGKVQVNGTISATGAITGNASDLQFKKVLKSETNYLHKLSAISVHRYTYKQSEYPMMNFNDRLQHGFIAQELEKIFPELVFDMEHDEWSREENKSLVKFKYKTINYIGMIPVLTASINEQQQIIASQQNEILELKNLLFSLTERIDSLLTDESK